VRIGGGSEIAVGSKGNDGAGLGLVGGTIVGGTIVGGSSIGVAAKLAVDGASEPVASHGIDERSTCCTTTGGMGENRSTAGLGAHGAAGLGASSPGVNIAVNVQHNLLQGLIWVRAGAARSMWATGVMTERVLVSVPIVPQFLEQALKQALKPYQPEALTSRGQRCCRSKMTV
jgi:hypothetical protein